MTGDLFLKKPKKKKTTSRATANNAERRAADFHAPGQGRRTPLSGSNSGHTHADCMYIPGMYIEAKLRASHTVWTLYSNVRRIAKKENLVPVVSLFKKYEKGFLDVIHSDYIDVYVQRMTENRNIRVKPAKKVMFGETTLPLLHQGAPSEIEFVLANLNTRSFDVSGHLIDGWATAKGDKLELFCIVPDGFSRALYARFKSPLKKTVYLDPIKVRRAMRK